MFIRNKSGNLAIGRVARDPEMREFNSGKSKAGFSILYGEDANDKDEQGRPRGLFLNVDAWGAVGRDAMMLEKGDYIAAVGRLDTHEYNGKQYTALVADAIFPDVGAVSRMLANAAGGASYDAAAPSGYLDAETPVKADPFGAMSDDDGDLPF